VAMQVRATYGVVRHESMKSIDLSTEICDGVMKKLILRQIYQGPNWGFKSINQITND